MNKTHCPHCDTPLPDKTSAYCALCGEAFFSATEVADAHDITEVVVRPGTTPVLRAAHANASAELVDTPDPTEKRSRTYRSTVSVATSTRDADEAPKRHLTWQKVVETPSRPMAVYPPRPPLPPQSLPVLRHLPYSWFALPRTLFRPRSIFWICLVLIVLVVGSGTLGMVEAFKHNSSASNHPSGPMLQVAPAIAEAGAILSISGSGLSPLTQIGLFRDAAIPVYDTNNLSILNSDTNGIVNDTVIIGSDWGGGPHTIILEDAHTHHYISTPIQVIGDIGPLRPAHLHISENQLDFGAGDQATNTLKKISLSNSGAGQIAWQATTTQPWLMLSPQSGILSANAPPTDVMVAVNRADLQAGDYAAQVNFSSSAGDSRLPIKMQVLPLQAGHEPVLQLTPAVLSFTGADGGSNPDPQVITVSNPGALPLSWKATTDASWLSVSANNTVVDPTGSSTAQVKVNTSSLLPGTYSAHVTFASTGKASVLHSPQSVYVSVTITPNCSLQISPGMLDMTTIYQQSTNISKSITLNQTQSCSEPVSWSAQSNTPWLSVSQAHGVTPAAPVVVANTSSLNPGSYTGSITFTSGHGTQVLLVSLSVNKPDRPALNLGLSTLSFSASAQGSSPPAQMLSLKNSGGAPLSWSASAISLAGGAWLSLNQSSGQLNAHQSTILSVRAALLNTLTPNTYTGLIRVFARDAAGNLLSQNPQVIPVNLVVSPACSLQVSSQPLTFYGLAGQANTSGANAVKSANVVSMTTSSSCKSSLNWSAGVSTTDGGNWLHATPRNGSLAPNKSATTQVSVTLAGLKAGPYSGQLTLTATDSSKKVVSTQSIDVYLTVQPPCTLQAPSLSSLDFSALGSAEPAAQSFTIGVVGTCSSGAVKIIPTGVTASSPSWLTVSPANAVLKSGQSATFTVTPHTAGLAKGSQYSGSISLVALDNGIAIVGSSQSLPVSLSLAGTPKLVAGPGSLNLSVSPGKATQLITINNAGDAPLDWTASLQMGAASYFSLSTSGGKQLAAGSTTNVNLIMDTTTAPPGTYVPNVVINATNSLTGGNVGTVTIPVTVVVVVPPAMSVDTTNLSFSTVAGSNPADQSVTISNSGGGTLNWTASAPDQPWLTLGSTSGLANASTTSTLVFKVNVSGLAGQPQPYTASTTLTPSVGAPITITVNLAVAAVTPTADPTQPATPPPQAQVTPTAQVKITPTPVSSPVAGTTSTAVTQVPVVATTHPVASPTVKGTATPHSKPVSK
ncbi:BACON domain-containing protein [Dictyobacter kobayashii]|uniref:BACON domain-containing protein n=1 Tax=Dictyobacter kobayashii TaxID=2014872 RepID=A0A402AIH4_9CHLR|nr:choice-of-anchor D domain-containing protein [Dictyobacter kobayashii]GCE18863.1 hypothetical protein KDK_26630 [Dictyobacter kobayashii]